ncbi:site-specific integrase [Deinococcus sp.]|uniref:tyrosine-type recombinase/integrase n=1 Tax=Deinococcus sp. TaxID=47478 RepID=UPI0025BCF34E|nr:site-specific integrase [Deinococcus sp.]
MTRTKTTKPQGRRGNGEGSIREVRQLPTGEKVYSWAIRVTLRSGEHRRIKGTYQGRSITEAREQMWAAKRTHEGMDAPARAAQLTYADLLDEWMRRKREQEGLSPRTLQIQRELIENHVKPRLGSWKLTALDTTALNDFHINLKDSSTLERSRYQIHTVLRLSLGYALEAKYITSNPALNVTVPKRQEKRKATRKVSAWTPEQARQLEQAALGSDDMLGFAIAFALRTGLRRGELFGLRWQDVDLKAGTLRVEQALATYGTKSRTLTEPKNESSRRTVHLSPKAQEILGRVLDLQAQRQQPGQPDPTYVFTTRKGEMQHPNSLNRKVKKLCDDLGIPALSVHALRHTIDLLRKSRHVDNGAITHRRNEVDA